ncbi:MAG: SufD family Fe-S cluster assembly protein [Chloroflexi bacterium]|nr:SufD family Fe-S cluster assembly protein [Chloroflexota bacterium]
MASPDIPTRPSPALVEAISAFLDEPTWLRDRRLEALRAYDVLSWPSGEEEEWRRTPMAGVPLDDYTVHLPSAAGAPARLAALGLDSGSRVAQTDGVLLAQSLDPTLAAQGVILAPLSQAAREDEALVRAYLHATVPVTESRFTALSAALWTQGLFCYVPKGVQADLPLRHLIGKSAPGAGAQGLFGQTLLVAGEGAAVSLIEAAASDDGPAGASAFAHRTVEIAAGVNSDVRYVGLQHWGHDVNAFVTQRLRTARDARVLSASVAFGGRLSRERIVLDAAEAGISADLVGLFVGTGDQHIEYDTRQDHTAVGGRSDLQIKGALDDRASAVQYGVVAISPEGQKTSGHQTMRNLLLSSGAAADPIPVLEIEADDVQCSHAAAVGPVDPDHIFYLQTRGIPPEEAERMVVQGFLDVVTQRLPDEDLRHAVDELVHERLDPVPAKDDGGGP